MSVQQSRTATSPLKLPLQHRFASELEGCCVPWQGAEVPHPAILEYNHALAEELGLPETLNSDEGARLLCGMTIPEGCRPVAQAYAGHQFGNFVPQLGDGRALLLGELTDREGRLRDLHLKGSGPTPFSRGGDGKAGLGPVLREYLMGEAMHALGIPTTRALAVVATGEWVQRETRSPGAVLARIAASHLRVGSFEYLAHRCDWALLERLAEHAIERHDPDLAGDPDRFFRLLERVTERQIDLVARWMGIGFIHGVMNTDNMTLSGETIDYGPCAFMDSYHPDTVFSSIDRYGRYAYGNQPNILQWNLARFAEALLPLIDRDDIDRAVARATELVNEVPQRYRTAWLAVMRRKLGLLQAQADDEALIRDLLQLMQEQEVDFTLCFRHLGAAADGDRAPLRALFRAPEPLDAWLARWQQRLASEDTAPEQRRETMRHANPVYVPRNHKVEEALEAAVGQGDPGPLHRLMEVLADPFTVRPGLEDWAQPAPPAFGPYQTFCGT